MLTSLFKILYLSNSSPLKKGGGARRDRTDDLLRARQALSQLSYGPLTCLLRVWRYWLLSHFVHVPMWTLPRSFAVRLASHKKSCVRP